MDEHQRTLPTGFRVENALMLNGMALGDLIAAPTAKLMMNGTVCGDLIVQAGASVDLNGTVRGALVNSGGTVTVRGVVGRIASEGGAVTVAKGAVVNGRAVPATYSA